MNNNKYILYLLIGLSALTACAQYIIQGTLATGGTPASFAQPFLLADSALWGARALIEAAVIAYLFQTVPHSTAQSIVLTCFEVALVSLITLTVGPALRAMGLGLPIRETLSPGVFTLWNFGIAGYTSIMMGAAGFAYRVQSQATVEQEAQEERNKPSVELTKERKAMLEAWRADPLASNTSVARLVGCAVSTVGRAMAELQAQGVVRKNGKGVEVLAL
jgi:hypothetical protein